jgi:hypothetical protein
MRFASVATAVRKGDIARFPAIGTIVQAIHAELYGVLPLTNRAVFFARAIGFHFVAHDTDNWTSHGSLLKNST